MTSSGELDVDALEKRVQVLVDSEDIQGLADLDLEIRAHLDVGGERDAGKKAMLGRDDLEHLARIYSVLTEQVGLIRSRLASEVRGLKTNQKGISAYRSSD